MRALVELALAGGRSPISAALIAKHQALSVAYLEQLLHRLKKRGLLSSVRGPKGGYTLAKEPCRITMAQVVQVLDGTNGALHPDERTDRDVRNGKGRKSLHLAAGARDAHKYAQRIAHAVWQCVHERLFESLDSVTLQDLCDQVKSEADQPLDHRYVFHI